MKEFFAGGFPLFMWDIWEEMFGVQISITTAITSTITIVIICIVDIIVIIVIMMIMIIIIIVAVGGGISRGALKGNDSVEELADNLDPFIIIFLA